MTDLAPHSRLLGRGGWPGTGLAGPEEQTTAEKFDITCIVTEARMTGNVYHGLHLSKIIRIINDGSKVSLEPLGMIRMHTGSGRAYEYTNPMGFGSIHMLRTRRIWRKSHVAEHTKNMPSRHPSVRSLSPGPRSTGNMNYLMLRLSRLFGVAIINSLAISGTLFLAAVQFNCMFYRSVHFSLRHVF